MKTSIHNKMTPARQPAAGSAIKPDRNTFSEALARLNNQPPPTTTPAEMKAKRSNWGQRAAREAPSLSRPSIGLPFRILAGSSAMRARRQTAPAYEASQEASE